MTEPKQYDVAAQSVAAIRRLQLEVARLVTTADDDPHADNFHDWLLGLPLPDPGSAARPLQSFGCAVTIAFDRIAWSALGATSAMIEPMAEFFRSVDASHDELERLSRLGALIEPDALGSWIETAGDTFNVGWTMVGDLESPSALAVLDDKRQRRVIERFLGDAGSAALTSVGRSVGAGSVTSRTLVRIGSAGDDAAVAAATTLLADLDAPVLDDSVLGAMLAEAGDGTLSVALRSLDDGFARVGVVVNEPSMSLIVRLAGDGGWIDALDRVAMVQAAVDAEHPSSVDCFISDHGQGVELFYEVPAG